jgi:hypothetical protein
VGRHSIVILYVPLFLTSWEFLVLSSRTTGEGYASDWLVCSWKLCMMPGSTIFEFREKIE